MQPTTILFVIALFTFPTCYLITWKRQKNNSPPIDQPIEEMSTDQTIEDEITHLESQKEGYTRLYYELEKQLETAATNRKITIERQLLTLDNKIFIIDKKINKLNESG